MGALAVASRFSGFNALQATKPTPLVNTHGCRSFWVLLEAMQESVAELLEQLRLLGETSRLEVKRGGAISRSVTETVCSFSNEPGLGGGTLLLGVDEDRERLIPLYPVVGVKDVDKLTNDLLSQCNDLFNVALRPTITPVPVEGKTVLQVFVPEVAAANKPVYFKKEGLPEGAYRRLASGDVRCTEDDLAAFYDERGGETFDASVMARATWDDIDLDAIEDYRRERRESSADAIELSWTDEELLHSLDCLRRENGVGKPTVAGVLLFGSKQALRRLFPMLRVDYIRVPGREWVPNPEKRFDSIDMRDPLMRVVRRSLNATLEDFAQPFSLSEGEAQRGASQGLPSRALREALVNAVMHRSYREQSPVQIIRYLNRLEIRNPGYSLKNEERWGEPRSINRNPTVAAVLHETRFAETKGSGMRVMREEMEKVGLSPPLFESHRDGNEFVVTFLTHHFLAAQDWEWLAAFKDLKLSDEEAKALIWVRETGETSGAINNAVYRNLSGVDAREAHYRLRHLCNLELLVPRGKGSTVFYTPGPEFLKRLKSVANAETPLAGMSAMSDSGAGIPDNEVTMSDNEVGIADKPAEDHKREALLARLSPVLQSRVQAMGKRTKPEELRRVLRELCSVETWTAKELALLVGRNPKHLVEEHLTPMLDKGVLQPVVPHSRRHPKQAYKSTTPDIMGEE